MLQKLFFHGLFFSSILSACNNVNDLVHESAVAKKDDAFHLYIQPFEDVGDSTIFFLKDNLSHVYNASITILPLQLLPSSAWYAERKRYWADTLLRFLQPLAKSSQSYVLGVTGKDISTNKSDYPNWGVMGLGYMPGKCCVISDYRLHMYPRTRQHIDSQLLKVAIHEIGHNFGLKHCAIQTCFMADAEGKNTMDRENSFCEHCSIFLKKQHVLPN